MRTSLLCCRTIVIAAVMSALAVVTAAGAQPAQRIPMVKGLTMVSAGQMATGDIESIKRVVQVDDSGVRFRYAGTLVRPDGPPQRILVNGLVRPEDMRQGRRIKLSYSRSDDEVEPGSADPNLDHYGPRTAHGSSLSPAIHAAVLARAGRTDEAVRMFDLSARLGTSRTPLREALRIFRRHVPPAWVLNDTQRPDYGKDYLIEVVEARELTGLNFFVQLKGTESLPARGGGASVSHKLELKDEVYYADRVRQPLFLVVVDVNRDVGH